MAVRSPADPGPLAEDVAVERSELALVKQVIRALPARLRHPLLLAAGGLAMQEIAAVLGLPPGTVKWRISEARRVTREKVARRIEKGVAR
jgi:DNA-directed RNA polymerase specialized sigma24 family protein